MLRRLTTVLSALVLLLIAAPAIPAPAAAPVTKVLVFSKTAGFRHDAIPAGIAAIQTLGSQNGFSVTATEDAGQFTTANLAQYQAVVWLSTTGDVLNATQQTAFQSYIAAGGGYVGVHAAADTEYDWPWYGGLVGAYFNSHPAIQQATVRVEDATNPATAHLPAAWVRTDEWYNYRANPRANVRVLLSLDESTYSGGSMAGDHPITWCQNYQGGRAFYTGLGHTQESYADANFTRLLLGGIRFAGGAVTADCTPRTNPVPAGTALRSKANNKFVSTAAGNLIASATTASTAAERFDIVPLTGSNVALRSKATGQYVCAENSGNNPLIANRAAVGSWETFTRITNSDGTVSFRATVNNRYVTAENAGASALIANRTAIGPWEKFDLVTGG
ncbi:glycosyl hydrolase [Actinoplanes sp. TBRC 11911]|uniref:ThuA domain-containing protein n=1 Tax=Actinoplanes sp. TBRC 11911 TaxID=2729386 RepID=UPI00145F4F01|nr:glycosyl hydrolase [Actinoplanes sp. TBRC 11911]